MATTFYDTTTGYWTRKIKTLTGRYRKIKLGRPDNDVLDPLLIPNYILSLGDRWQDEHKVIVSNAVLTAFGPKVGTHALNQLDGTDRIDLYQRLETYYRQQTKAIRPLSLEKLRMVIDRFTTYCKSRGIGYLDEVRAKTVQAFLDSELEDRERRGKSIALHTLKSYLSLLGKCWSRAIRLEEYYGQNPIRAVCKDLPSSDTETKPDSLTPEEIDALLVEIAFRKSRPFRKGPSSRLPQWVEDAVVLMLNTGLRVNAAVNLQFDWIEGNKLTVPMKYSKSGKAYSTVVNTKVKAVIDRRRVELGRDAERVFPEIKGPSWLYSRLDYLAKSCVRKGLWKRDKGHYCHIMRHTFITESLKAGVPLVMVSKLAGHTSVAMTQRYDQSTHEDAIQWALNKGISL